MNDATRRGFLATAGAGAAAVGITAIAPAAQAAPHSSAKAAPAAGVPKHAHGALVAHVADVHGDTVTLMFGEREVVVKDAELVARLANHAF